MTAALVLLALVGAFAAGAVVESRRHACPDDKRLRIACNGLIRWRNDALKWRATAEGHAAVLRALGRTVAEGGTAIDGRDPRHPSMRKDGPDAR